jgi:hypothetical protein
MASSAMKQAGLFVGDGMPVILVSFQKNFIPPVAFLAQSFIVRFA